MKIELHISGQLTRAWIIEDIREPGTEKGGVAWLRRVTREINKIKMDIYWLLQYNDYEFFTVYESKTSSVIIRNIDMDFFNKQIKIKRMGRSAKVIRKAS